MIFAISRSYFAEFSRNVPLQNGRKLFFGQIFLFTLLTHCLRLLQAYPLSICLLFSSPILLSSILFISMISSILPPPPLFLCAHLMSLPNLHSHSIFLLFLLPLILLPKSCLISLFLLRPLQIYTKV